MAHKRAKAAGFRRYSLRTLLLIVAVVGVAFALARIALSPTPRSIMQAARVGVANFGGDEHPSALLVLSAKTSLSPRTIDAIATFNEERPVRGVIFKHRAIGPEDVRLLENLQNLEMINVRDAMAISPDLLTALPNKPELKKVTMYDSDLSGLSFPEELPLRVLCLDDSIISSSQLHSVATYSQLTQFSACGTSLTEPMEFLGHLTELRHVSLVPKQAIIRSLL